MKYDPPCKLTLKPTEDLNNPDAEETDGLTTETKNDNELNCISWNINGIGDKLTVASTAEYFQNYDIVMLCETWLKDNDCDNVYLRNFNVFHTVRKSLHRKARRGSGGITIFVRKCIDAEIVSEVCDHVVVLEINKFKGVNQGIGNKKLYLIVCYIPPKSTTYQCSLCSGDYFAELSTLVERYSQLGNVFVTGDMNARTGKLTDFVHHSGNDCVHPCACDCTTEWTPPTRSSKDTTVNEYGRELIELCRSCNLVIVNGRVKPDTEGNFTRVVAV